MHHRSLSPVSHPAPAFVDMDALHNHIAQATIGRTVDLLAGAKTIVHGVVTGVLTESGTPKIVVGGARYDVKQILTIAPTRLY
jgi:hypothetical protein